MGTTEATGLSQSRDGWHPGGISRRSFIAGAAATTAGGAGALWLLGAARGLPTAERALVPISMAMHVHASASEGPGSMQAQLVQAVRTGVDVLWWTEHDHRMAAHAAPTHITFRGLHETRPGAAPWSWQPATEGNARFAAHRFDTRAERPQIAPQESALHVSLQARGQAPATHLLSGQAENLLHRTSLAKMTISIDVMPEEISPTGYLAIDLMTSYRPRYAGQPEGRYALSYRIGGAGLPGTSKLLDSRTAVIYLAAPASRWSTLTLVPALDLERLWPGVNGSDASLFEFALRAGAYARGEVRGYFANLTFDRADRSGNKPLAVQSDLMASYAPLYPTVHQIQALEVSLTTPHIGWYGGRIQIPDYRDQGPMPSRDPAVARAAVQTIHDSGGLASYCHPFGTDTAPLSRRQQELARTEKCAELIRNRALGCDLLEVGYRMRGGCDLKQHESVWDNCSRNGIALTGIGVSDDHKGEDWIGEMLNFLTWAWAPATSEADLLAALKRGRVFFGDPARYRGALDIRIGAKSVMGTVSTSIASTRTLTVLATGVPAGATIRVLRGTVDYAGPSNTDPDMMATHLSAAELSAAGTSTITVDTTESRFVRLVVEDRGGTSIAFSNPVWLLRAAPPHPFPDCRILKSDR